MVAITACTIFRATLRRQIELECEGETPGGNGKAVDAGWWSNESEIFLSTLVLVVIHRYSRVHGQSVSQHHSQLVLRFPHLSLWLCAVERSFTFVFFCHRATGGARCRVIVLILGGLWFGISAISAGMTVEKGHLANGDKNRRKFTRKQLGICVAWWDELYIEIFNVTSIQALETFENSRLLP